MKKIVAIFFALLLFSSNSGILIAGHYCMGELADYRIGYSTEAHKCNMAKVNEVCEKETPLKGGSLSTKDCCDDSFVQFQLNESFNAPSPIDAEINTEFLAAFTVVYLNLHNFQPEASADYVDYSPPLLQQDIPVLFQSFLV